MKSKNEIFGIKPASLFSEYVVTQSQSIHQYPDQTNSPSHG